MVVYNKRKRKKLSFQDYDNKLTLLRKKQWIRGVSKATVLTNQAEAIDKTSNFNDKANSTRSTAHKTRPIQKTPGAALASIGKDIYYEEKVTDIVLKCWMARPWHFACLLMMMDRGLKDYFVNYYLLSIIVRSGLINPIGKIISLINSDVIILFLMYVQSDMYVDFYTSGNLYFIDHCRSYLWLSFLSMTYRTN